MGVFSWERQDNGHMRQFCSYPLRCPRCASWNMGHDPADIEGAWCPECGCCTDLFEAFKAGIGGMK